MNGKRPNNQYTLALAPAEQGEALATGIQGTESLATKPIPENLGWMETLMEEVCERENLERAWKRVKGNKGGPGVDGMTIESARDHLREQWPNIRSQLLEGTYQPQPVKRVEIPKPAGGVRKLGVPCVVDRLIQQALLQVFQKQWDPRRSPSIATASDRDDPPISIDLEKFFDRVNHDRLMARVTQRASDLRVLKLIRAFLTAGMMENGSR